MRSFKDLLRPREKKGIEILDLREPGKSYDFVVVTCETFDPSKPEERSFYAYSDRANSPNRTLEAIRKQYGFAAQNIVRPKVLKNVSVYGLSASEWHDWQDSQLDFYSWLEIQSDESH